MAQDRRRPPERTEDRISGLPDDLLHGILVDLGSVRAAARTSVLSRRWRHVWTRIPNLVLFNRDDLPPPSSFQTSVDAALAAHSAPIIKDFQITVPTDGPRVPACRVEQWLRGVSQRVVGSLGVFVRWSMEMSRVLTPVTKEEEEELEIPTCGGATRILLKLDERWRLRIPAAGLFAALTLLTMESARLEGSELTALVSTQCPRLKTLFLAVTLCTVSDVSMRTESLEALFFHVTNTRCLEIVAPRLEQLNVSDVFIEANISAPKLAKLNWRGIYDPCRHKFADVGRYLRLLNIYQTRTGASLLHRFYTVDELKLTISIEQMNPCPQSCLCRLAKSSKIDDITLGSLEEVEINNFTSSQEELEFVEQLSRCNAAVLKKIVICYTRWPRTPLTKEMCEKVRSMCRSNLKFEFYVTSDMFGWMPFD
ncbi:hypothetical protein EJB05_11964, partial [Eragrostis curvula]